MASVPSVQFNDRTYVMVDHETGTLVQSGSTVVISRREVEDTVARIERYKATNHPKADAYDDKLAAFRELLGSSAAPSSKPAAKKG